MGHITVRLTYYQNHQQRLSLLMILKLINKIIYNFPEMRLRPYRQNNIIFHTLF